MTFAMILFQQNLNMGGGPVAPPIADEGIIVAGGVTQRIIAGDPPGRIIKGGIPTRIIGGD